VEPAVDDAADDGVAEEDDVAAEEDMVESVVGYSVTVGAVTVVVTVTGSEQSSST
jgi:hypothetical protein